ncbi:SDR family NAD(P)-dependent oxidoreductase [Legionella sp. W05-934-2]|jgi:NAD(P)-dependent dehydrogenase (short-subunit alcohol dehydrogenase family)|uniref:SDR family NAD(P)-dependent oxidoreductase n=1 Tax=Legionella sp. W05-934-2 TaxID=1198649 RepID=UPI0034622D41
MDQSLQTFVITGATSGIGLEITRGLLQANKNVIMIVRNPDLADRRIAEFKRDFPHCQLSYIIADLASQQQVESAASQLRYHCEQIHGLINNAGIFMTSHKLSEDGIELTFAVNHMSHFILTQLLLDRLAASGSGRIVMLGSHAHTFVDRIQFDNIGWQKKFRSLKVYGQSKLANLLFMRQIAKQLPSTVTINSADPGAVATRIGCNNGKLEQIVSAVFRQFYRSIPKGAETPLYLALSPDVEGCSGLFYKDKQKIDPSASAQSDNLAQQLWDFSMQSWKNASLINHAQDILRCQRQADHSIV